jgi:hypothetical protein
MGKTALLHRALVRAHDQGAAAFIADLSTASSPVDLANRVMESATRALRRRWTDTASEFVRRLKAVLSFSPDISTGLIIPSFELSLRSDTPDAQRDTLLKVLDAIEAMARERDTPIAIMLDESQELHQLGGKPLMAQLRASMEHHTHELHPLHLGQRLRAATRGTGASALRPARAPRPGPHRAHPLRAVDR